MPKKASNKKTIKPEQPEERPISHEYDKIPILKLMDEYFGGNKEKMIQYLERKNEANALWRAKNYRYHDMEYEAKYDRIDVTIESVQRRIEKEEMQEQLREDDEWADFDYAHALFDYLKEKGEFKEADGLDVYCLFYEDTYITNELHRFEFNKKEWVICKEKDANDAAEAYVKNSMEDMGLEGWSEGFIQNYIDGDRVASDWEDYYRESIEESPDSYLDEADRELSEYQEEELAEKREELERLEEERNEMETDTPEGEQRYEEIEERISELEEEIEEIENNPEGDWPEDVKERKLEELLDEIRDDPIEHLKSIYGSVREFSDELKRYVDEDELAEAAVQADGAGHFLSHYDGAERHHSYNGEDYSIFRLN
jgi:hypothetical protein